MITRRPRLPVGHSLPDLPAITHVLHTGEDYELYRLSSPSPTSSILLLLTAANSFSIGNEILLEWWAAQPAEFGVSVRAYPSAALPHPGEARVIVVRGQCAQEANFAEASSTALENLLNAMLDAIERAASANIFPDFAPWSTWWAPETASVFPLLPSRALPASNQQTALCAKAFYHLATGVEFNPDPNQKASIKRWARNSGDRLDKIIERCLPPHTSSGKAITTLGDLYQALDREIPQRIADLSQAANDLAAASLEPAKPKGLARVAGMVKLKELLQREVVEPIRNPGPYRSYGLSIPNGILLYGPPGCGKTYIARQLAEELGHHFAEIIPSELASPYIHQTVIHIRDVFHSAAEHAPSIVFIDEFEAMVPARSELGAHQHYKSEEVNEFLAQLSGCSDKGVFVIAASNQPHRIDPAVRRTGRLDKLIYVGPPDKEARQEMLALHLQDRPVAKDCDLGAIADKLQGYSASDIHFLVNEAARDAFLHKEPISQRSIQSARTRIHPSVTKSVEDQYAAFEQRG
jgi:hypothetical protein